MNHQAVIEQVTPSLEDLEAVIEKGKHTWIEVGKALETIREEKLYSKAGFSTFEEYCLKRHGFARQTAYDQIHAAQVAENVRTCVHTQPTLAQARALSVLSPAKQREVAVSVDMATATVRALQSIANKAKREAQLSEGHGNGDLNSVRRDERFADPAHAQPPAQGKPEGVGGQVLSRQVADRVTVVLGQIDLDPCVRTDSTVPAERVLDTDDDGLSCEWEGRIYLNPPTGKQRKRWVRKLIGEYTSGRVTEAIAVQQPIGESAWLGGCDCAICIVNGDSQPDNSDEPILLLYLGPDVAKFAHAFADIGRVWAPWREPSPTDSATPSDSLAASETNAVEPCLLSRDDAEDLLAELTEEEVAHEQL